MSKKILGELHTIKRWMSKLNILENVNENSDPTKEEMINVLNSEMGGFEGMDKFSAEEAIYWYAYNNHGGQWSNLYSVLSTSEYKPSPLMKNIEDSSDEMSLAMYNTLVSNFGGEEISLDSNDDEYADEINETTPAIQNKNHALKQWFGSDSKLYLVTKPENEWDESDHDLFNRLLAMVEKDGQVPAYGKK